MPLGLGQETPMYTQSFNVPDAADPQTAALRAVAQRGSDPALQTHFDATIDADAAVPA